MSKCKRGKSWTLASCHGSPQGCKGPTVGSTQSPTGSVKDGEGRQTAVKNSIQHLGPLGMCFTSCGSPAHRAPGDAI